jgi:hypothetical protein
MALTLTKTKLQDTYTYIPEDQRGEEKPFSVEFKRIPLDELADLQDKSFVLTQSGSYTISINTQHLNALRYALVGWDNITDDKGKAFKFRIVHNEASEESLELLPPELRAEIASVIIEVSKNPANADSILGNEDDK